MVTFFMPNDIIVQSNKQDKLVIIELFCVSFQQPSWFTKILPTNPK
jgi:hypothetical protein